MVLYYIYLSCFLFGATLLVCQFLLSLVGLGGDHEGPGDHDASVGDHDSHDAVNDAQEVWFAGILTFRALITALAFFGVGGLSALQAGMDPYVSVAVAVALGGGALFGVAFLMRTLSKLRAEGTVRISRAVGATGTVYLNIPGSRQGPGKVHLNLQNRTVEYLAVTPNDALPTGSKVVVVGVLGSDTVEVISAIDPRSNPND